MPYEWTDEILKNGVAGIHLQFIVPCVSDRSRIYLNFTVRDPLEIVASSFSVTTLNTPRG